MARATKVRSLTLDVKAPSSFWAMLVINSMVEVRWRSMTSKSHSAREAQNEALIYVYLVVRLRCMEVGMEQRNLSSTQISITWWRWCKWTISMIFFKKCAHLPCLGWFCCNEAERPGSGKENMGGKETTRYRETEWEKMKKKNTRKRVQTICVTLLCINVCYTLQYVKDEWFFEDVWRTLPNKNKTKRPLFRDSRVKLFTFIFTP